MNMFKGKYSLVRFNKDRLIMKTDQGSYYIVNSRDVVHVECNTPDDDEVVYKFIEKTGPVAAIVFEGAYNVREWDDQLARFLLDRGGE